MKKILLALALSFGLMSALNAQDVDVLALVTKGAVSDNSKGVKVLSLDDKMQVKGGYRIYTNAAGQQVFTFLNLNTGITKIAQIGVVIGLDEYELDNKVSCGLGYTGCSKDSYINRQGYYDYMSVANQELGQYLALTATKTTIVTTIGYFSIPQVKFSTGAMVVGITNSGSVYRIRSANPNRITNEVSQRVGNDLARILYTNY